MSKFKGPEQFIWTLHINHLIIKYSGRERTIMIKLCFHCMPSQLALWGFKEPTLKSKFGNKFEGKKMTAKTNKTLNCFKAT